MSPANATARPSCRIESGDTLNYLTSEGNTLFGIWRCSAFEAGLTLTDVSGTSTTTQFGRDFVVHYPNQTTVQSPDQAAVAYDDYNWFDPDPVYLSSSHTYRIFFSQPGVLYYVDADDASDVCDGPDEAWIPSWVSSVRLGS